MPKRSCKERSSISEDDLEDLHGKVAIVTGSNAGIGYATVQFLVRKGAKVKENIGDGTLEWLKLDLSDVKQTKAAALEVIRKERRLAILVNNAAIVHGPYKQTQYGILDIMLVNHVSTFVFTMALLPLLTRTAREDNSDVRIITVSSGAHELVKPADFVGEDSLNLQFENSFSGNLRTYGYSKLANILFTKELQKRLIAEGFGNIICIALHPGAVTTPGSRRFTDTVPVLGGLTSLLNPLLFATPRAGAYTSAFSAASPEVRENAAEYRGAYLVPVAKIAKATKYAEDQRLARELWETTEAVVRRLGVL
ncbi:hypothetical protein D9613_012457 [Agrocybe pediades]|uniref:NAD(P)-binding protein n=1 Tax=Agrocybe pediades TaxID=84607 RepID=A0A8H4QS37_9AGAR|nr:hypothetical protein D9613_012457 [Agrocybe pediades]